MNHKLLFLIVLFLLHTELYSQYVGPNKRSLKFRIYGRDAKPISEKDKDYKIIPEEGNLIKEENHPSFHHQINTLDLNGCTYRLHDFPATFSINNKNEIMEIKSEADIDSLYFVPGKYVIAREYESLFTMKAMNQTIIKNQKLEYFKTNSLEKEPSLKKVICTEKKSLSVNHTKIHFTGENYTAIKTIPGTEEILLAGQASFLIEDKRIFQNFLLKRKNESSEWEKMNFPPSRKIIFEICFIDRYKGWALTTNGSSSNYEVYKTEDGGINWVSDQNLTNSNISEIIFTDNNTAVLKGDNEIYISRDGLKTKELIYTIRGKNFHRQLFVLNENNIYLNLHDNYNYLLFHLKHDGNNKWLCDSSKALLNNLIALDSKTAFKIMSPNAYRPILSVTTNGGKTWSDLIELRNASYFQCVADQNNSMYIFGHAFVLKTHDLGATWEYLATEKCLYRFNDYYFRKKNEELVFLSTPYGISILDMNQLR